MVGCCGYLLGVCLRTTWFGFQDAQGIIWLQFFQALSNAAIGLLFWVLYRRRWNPQSVSNFLGVSARWPPYAPCCMCCPMSMAVSRSSVVLESISAGSILLAATIRAPLLFPRTTAGGLLCAERFRRTLFQTLATAAFSLSAAVGLQTALPVLMLMLLLGSFVFYIPTMRKKRLPTGSDLGATDASADGGVAESEELLSTPERTRRPAEYEFGRRNAISPMPLDPEEERWRELSRRFSLTR